MNSTILVVDDDALSRKMVLRYLEKAHFQVLEAGDGATAIERARNARPDVVLLDVEMPEMDGYRVCELLQADSITSDIPVIFLTSLSEDRDRVRGFQVGATGYLTKPVEPKELVEAVERGIGHKQVWEALQDQSGAANSGSMLPDGAFNAFVEKLPELLERPIDEACRGALVVERFYHQLDALEVDAQAVARAVARFLDLPYLERIEPEEVEMGMLPTSFCIANLVVPIRQDGEVRLALSNPFDEVLSDLLGRGLGADWAQSLPLVVVEPVSICRLGRRASDRASARVETMTELACEIEEAFRTADAAMVDAKDNLAASDESPIVRVIDALILRARVEGATDIHIEPDEKSLRVRFRVDGRLREVSRFQSKAAANAFVSRIKIMSGLDIAERRLPQDGRTTFTLGDPPCELDLRVAVTPVRWGEMVVLRLLESERSSSTLEALGMSTYNAERYRNGLRHTSGMILHVGPTGSGKSATLYSALAELNSVEAKILTAEDPIEYTLEGVNQVQMRPDIGLDFSRALRSFLRLDPDIILVGEIRDLETARIAVEAALTGHLLLSTLHANDAASTVLRLTDIGLDGVVVSSALRTVCSQRLIRRLCLQCREAYQPARRERELVGVCGGNLEEIYRARGCPACRGTGFKGRIGIHETLIVDDALRDFIKGRGVSGHEVERLAIAGGMRPIFTDAMEKVRDGVTSLDDALLVVMPPEDLLGTAQQLALPRAS